MMRVMMRDPLGIDVETTSGTPSVVAQAVTRFAEAMVTDGLGFSVVVTHVDRRHCLECDSDTPEDVDNRDRAVCAVCGVPYEESGS